MKRAFLSLWALLAFLSLAPTASAQDTRFSAIDSLLARWDTREEPGFTLGIIEKGELAFAKGYGLANLEYGIPISSESIFRIASTSKQFTAACILLLEQQGKLSRDEKLRLYFPDFPDYADSITIRQLIHHTSGIRDYLTLAELAGMREEDYYTDTEVMDWLIRQKDTNFEPGSSYLYSNSGYWLLGQIVRKVSGMPMSQFADEQIFQPLGMVHTHFHDDPSRVVEKRASGYQPHEEGEFRIFVTPLPMIGDGGIFTSVEDLKLWDDAYYSSEVLNEAFWRAMQQRGMLNNGDTLDYAAGLVIRDFNGLRTVSHGGSFVGYRAEMLRVPEKRLTIILLANRSDINPSGLVHSILKLLLPEHSQEQEKQSEAAARSFISLPVERLRAFTGDFEHEAGAKASLLVENDTLRILQTWNGRRRTLLPVGENAFVEMGNPGYKVSFSKDDKSEVNAMHHQPAGGQEAIFQKLLPFDAAGLRLEEFTGIFYSEELLTHYSISLRAGQLHAQAGRREPQALEPIGEGRFRMGLTKLRFHRNADGRVAVLELEAGRVRGIRCIKQ